MKKSVLNQISVVQDIDYEGWCNGKHGIIKDADKNGIFRFFETIRECGRLVCLHKKSEDNPIVIEGIVGYWMKYRTETLYVENIFENFTRKPKSIKEQFDDYTEERFQRFKIKHRDAPSTWKWDWEYEFFCKYIIPLEMSLNKKTEALFEFISDDDIGEVQSVMDNYIDYLKYRRSALGYPDIAELKVLRYWENNNKYVLEGMPDYEFNMICDILEKNGYMKVAWVEGHVPEDARLLDKGKVYMKQLEEQEMKKKEKSQSQNVVVQEFNLKTTPDSIVAHDEDIDEKFPADNTKAEAKIPTFEYDEKTETIFLFGNPKTKNSEADAQKRSQGNITQEDLETYPALKLLLKLIPKERGPKETLMPYRAALEAEVLLPSMPSVNDFNRLFDTKLSRTGYSRYINSHDNPYYGERDARQFRILVKQFKDYK